MTLPPLFALQIAGQFIIEGGARLHCDSSIVLFDSHPTSEKQAFNFYLQQGKVVPSPHRKCHSNFSQNQVWLQSWGSFQVLVSWELSSSWK